MNWLRIGLEKSKPNTRGGLSYICSLIVLILLIVFFCSHSFSVVGREEFIAISMDKHNIVMVYRIPQSLNKKTQQQDTGADKNSNRQPLPNKWLSKIIA